MAWLHRPHGATSQLLRHPGPRAPGSAIGLDSRPGPAVAFQRAAGAARPRPLSTRDFTVTVVLECPVRRLFFRGELDLATSDKVYELLSGLIDPHASYIEIDLAEVCFIDCRGLGLLLRLRALMSDPHAVGLRNVSPSAHELLRVAGIAHLFNLY
jgi:anti-anti-sigma factor